MFFLLLNFFSAFVFAKNPNVRSPGPMTYTAGKPMEVAWDDGDTGYVNIDLVQDDPSILAFPMMIASVPREAGKYSFTLPESLKSAGKYHIRVWGDQQPQSGSSCISAPFTVLNVAPEAINSFTVTSPNKSNPCVADKVCKIAWDYPPNGMHPAMVDVSLYRVGNPYAIEHIGTFDSSVKSANWVVPHDSSIRQSDVYISVSGKGQPDVGPQQTTDMGGNSQAFIIAEPGSVSHQDASSDVQGQGHSKKEDKKDEKEDKKEDKDKDSKKDNKKDKKMDLPKVEPKDKKLTGAAAKDKNSASQITVSAGVFVGMAAAALMSVLF